LRLLLDSNIIIYLNTPFRNSILEKIQDNDIFVSWISYAEVIGFPDLKETDRNVFENFFREITKLDVSEFVIREAARLRQLRKLSLADAIIAATAILQDLTIVTANTKDFKKLKELNLLNPLT
jgi:predicted nucleic acid-binding protein